MAMSDLVHLEMSDGVGTLVLDSPGNRNALSAQMRRELLEQLETAIEDAVVRVIVLAHTGKVFCAGIDLKESRGASVNDQGVQELPRILSTLWESPKPVIAQLHGTARAGGIGLVAACDLAVAADSVTFAFSEVRLGLVPAVLSATVLPRLNPGAAREFFLTGELFDAEQAVQMGLINRSVPADQVETEVSRLAGLLRLGAPGALAATKQMLRRKRPDSLEEDLADMSTLSATAFAGEEGQEGLRAFAEKRKPSWVEKP
jgi:methylglutaconyl-CoA hydratase